MERLCLKIKDILKKVYYLYLPNLPYSGWKCTFVEDSNLPKLNVYYFFHPDSSNSHAHLLSK